MFYLETNWYDIFIKKPQNSCFFVLHSSPQAVSIAFDTYKTKFPVAKIINNVLTTNN